MDRTKSLELEGLVRLGSTTYRLCGPGQATVLGLILIQKIRIQAVTRASVIVVQWREHKSEHQRLEPLLLTQDLGKVTYLFGTQVGKRSGKLDVTSICSSPAILGFYHRVQWLPHLEMYLIFQRSLRGLWGLNGCHSLVLHGLVEQYAHPNKGGSSGEDVSWEQG